MTLESMVAPVPSEAVMPFAGFLWFQEKMALVPIIIFSTIGSIVGSLISYCIGLFGGRLFIEKFGRYFLLNKEHLASTEKFFNKFGAKTIFISRFIPIVRHLISLPAGMAKMSLPKFIVYTIIGAGLWNTFLTWLGYYLGGKWEIIRQYSEKIDIVVLIIFVATIIWWFAKRRTRKIIK
ncbi:DedA family protein [Candidatus Falkowbacteria bacterium]|nr:DedA family protein [Candidatus Falkowbacteria bacterium]